MLRNYLKIAVRNLTRKKGYSLINLSGLVIGFVSCLLIFSYVAYERSYDSFNPRADRIFRVQDEEYQNGKIVVPCASAMPGVAPFMRREFPEVEDAGRLTKTSILMSNPIRNIRFRELNIYFADNSIIGIFNLHILSGDPARALVGPDKIILSKSAATKYFPGESALGKVLTHSWGGKLRALQVTGVFSDYPGNSHAKFDLLVSYPTYAQYIGTYGKPDDPTETSFGWTDFYTYILLRPGVHEQQVWNKLPAFIDKHFNNQAENKAEGDRYTLSLMPLKNIHLYSDYTEEMEANGDGKSVSFLFLIAFFIITIAWINYINLATARSLERAREVGMRKVLGALRRELVGQFLLESVLLNLLALLVAICIGVLLTPAFNALTGKNLLNLLSLPANYSLIFIILFLTGTFLSGTYPAIVLSRYRPVLVLKGVFKNAAGGIWLRKALIVGQFAASIILIAGTLIVFRQLNYMRSQQLGADINETLVLKGPQEGLSDSAYDQVYHAFKEDMLRLKNVQSITGSSSVMGTEILWSTNWHRMRERSMQVSNLFHLGIDYDFIRSFRLKMLAGEAFNFENTIDNRAIILNETAVKVLGIRSPKEAIGELLSTGPGRWDSMRVVGVVADFHNEGLQRGIQPLVLLPNLRSGNFYSVKMSGKNLPSTLAAVKQIWSQHFVVTPFEYFFLDDFFELQYKENERFGNVFGIFATIAICIACFGLLGLSAYNVLQRTREIGIRKVLGASVQSILFLLSRDFLLLVLLSVLMAVPIVSWVMDNWLQSFAYRTLISWWIYVVAGALAVMIALVTIGFNAMKASVSNPIKSLRSE